MSRKTKKFSKLAFWLLRQVADSEEKNTVSGDIEELYNELVLTRGRIRSRIWLWYQVLYSVFLFIKVSILWSLIMFTNYLKTALRNLKKYKGYSLINIVGLAVGIASCLVILMFVRNELSYDRFHENADHIFRIALRGNIGANKFDIANGPPPLAAALMSDVSEIQKVTRMFHPEETYVKHENNQFLEEGFYFADSAFFDVFTVHLITGDVKKVLAEPNSVVLTPAMAIKYFQSTDDAIGKIIQTDGGQSYRVAGIAEELPLNSHFHFGFLASLSTLEVSRSDQWIQNSIYTYAVVQENVTKEQLDEKLLTLSEKYIAPLITEGLGISYQQFLDSGNYFGFFAQPLLDIHLHSELGNELGDNGNYNTVLVFSAIAMIILLIACVNFVNLATARSAQRANEVGVRKVLGSYRRNLINQFLSESFLLCTLAVVIALILVSLFLHSFNNLLGVQLDFSLFSRWIFVPALIGAVLFIGVLAGGYPALVLSSYQPVVVLKGKVQAGLKGRLFRNALVVLQFIISITLFISTIVVYSQLYFMRNKDLGYDKEQVVVIKNAGRIGSSQKTFKTQIKQNSQILNATYSQGLPQFDLSAQIYQKEGAGSNETHTLINIQVDNDFIDTYKIKVKDGRFFDINKSMDTLAVILNEASVKALNYENPLNQRLVVLRSNPVYLNIIGVYRDFHLQSLHETIRPMISTLLGGNVGNYLSVRITPVQIDETLHFLKTKWDEFVPDQPFEYQFFDDEFDEAYRTELQSGKVFTAFSILAILIACLGLFGLASFAASQRTKEIGIRKVYGATVSGIVALMSRDFLKWVLISNIIAWPVAYFAMSKWLQNFAYKIDLQLWVFVLSGSVAILIAILTVSYQAVKAALSNPVDAIRYE